MGLGLNPRFLVFKFIAFITNTVIKPNEATDHKMMLELTPPVLRSEQDLMISLNKRYFFECSGDVSA